ILQAEDGYEGIEIARRDRPDLILLDVMMPGINGFAVCRQLKAGETTRGIPIIMVTALRDVQYRIEGIEAGADEFLSRPHHREELLLRVKALLQLKQAREHLEQERNHLQLLYEISRAINAQLDLEQMMMTIIAQTQKAVNATKGTIILLDEAAHVTHRVVVREGEKPDLARSVPDEVMSHGLAGWILRNHRGTVIADARQDERWLALPDDREQPGSVVGVPLSRADRL